MTLTIRQRYHLWRCRALAIKLDRAACRGPVSTMAWWRMLDNSPHQSYGMIHHLFKQALRVRRQ